MTGRSWHALWSTGTTLRHQGFCRFYKGNVTILFGLFFNIRGCLLYCFFTGTEFAKAFCSKKNGNRGQKPLLANFCQNAKCCTAAGQGVHGSLDIAEWFDRQNQTGWQELLQQKQGCDVISFAHFLPHQVFSSCPFGLVFRINSSILLSLMYIA